MKRLTKKEEIIMNHFWDHGPLFVRELRELYPEPRPHFSTLSTQVRNLQVHPTRSLPNTGKTRRGNPFRSFRWSQSWPLPPSC